MGKATCFIEYSRMENPYRDARGRLLPKDGSHHLEGKLFAAGDMRNGQSLVVRALADGRSAAKEIHDWLRGRKG